MEGIHIRFGAVARGGIRWSNREDFRTEVIGLSHTQKVKKGYISSSQLGLDPQSKVATEYKKADHDQAKYNGGYHESNRGAGR